jgi:cysteine desulfurase
MIYFDNAATTPIDAEVIKTMTDVMANHFGNPSSVHEMGRKARVIVEDARRSVAGLLNVKPAEIFFTSCGTEALNTALNGAVRDMGVKNIITSVIEHHAVTHMLDFLTQQGLVKVHNINLLKFGVVDFEHLKKLIEVNRNSLVCLMHANNEIGNILPLQEVADLCKENQTYFISDTVQSLGKLKLDFKSAPLTFASCSAHKFHGPKGVGFLYIKGGTKISPLLHGGGQERTMRSGTENTIGIAGLAKALEIACKDMEKNRENISKLKAYMITRLKMTFPEIVLNSSESTETLYNLLNVSFPASDVSDMLLQRMDTEGICVSGGSACNSGAVSESPILKAIGADVSRPSIRFSFSKFNTIQEIDTCITVLKKIYKLKV